MNCPVCSGPVEDYHSTRKYCSPPCRERGTKDAVNARLRAKRRALKPAVEKSCEHCGGLFLVWPPRRYCSEACQKRAANRRAAERGYKRPVTESKRAHRRAAALRRKKAYSGVPERILDREIFERDGWLCGLCGDAVDSAVKHPDPLSPSLDHVVPLSRGGLHVRGNVQLAHLGCNLVKGACT